MSKQNIPFVCERLDTIVFGNDKKGPYWIEDEDSTSEKKHCLPVGFFLMFLKGLSLFLVILINMKVSDFHSL